MELTIYEMDKTNSVTSHKDEIFSENSSDQTDFGLRSDIAEVADTSIQNDLEISRQTIPIQNVSEQNNIAGTETNSVLLRNKDQNYPSLMEENSINVLVKGSTSLSNISDNELLEYEASDVNLSQEKYLQKSSSYNDIRSCLISNSLLSMSSPSVVSNEEHDIKCSEESVGEEHNDCSDKSNVKETTTTAQHFSKDTELVSNNEQLETQAKKEPKSFKIVTNTRPQQRVVSRPTLTDDSKLVKISLPTYPINIIQSNALFLNKSRNFLNFITEKSTNIMERALLPQHLTGKYNSVMRSMDNVSNEKKRVEFTSAEHLRRTSLANESDLTLKSKNVFCIEKNEMGAKIENKDCIKSTSESLSANTEQSNKCSVVNDCEIIRNNNAGTFQLSSMKQESHPTNDSGDKMDNNSGCTDAYSNSDINFTRLNNSNQKDETDSVELKRSLLQHPGYLSLLRDYADLKSKYLKLQERIECLEERNRALSAENQNEIIPAQMEMLQKSVNTLTHELKASEEAQEMLRKEYNSANKERESMVMKYAVSEKQLIDTQRARECAERKVKEMLKQQESLQSKLREMQGERARICNILDGKHREVTDLQKEVDKLREDVNMKDIRLKWTQNKLKTEMDLQKETQQKLDKAMTRVNEMKEECEQVRKETQESIRKFQRSEENKAVTLDQQLKEQQARLILERHVTEDKEMLRLQLQKEVETLKNRQQVLIEENNTLSLKIQDAEKNRLNYESNLSNLKIIAEQRQKEIVELLSKVSELETLKVQLQHKEQYLASTEAEIKHLRLANEELQADMSACRQKEAEMLDFTQKLTDKNVRLQSEFTATEAKTKKLEQEHGPLHERIRELTTTMKMLEEKLAQEQKTRTEECEILAKHLAEQTQAAQNLAQKLEDSQGENAVLKRKQQISMKEMTRELQQYRKKLEALESSSPYNSLGVTSRTGSNVSLNTGDTLNGALSDNSLNGDQSNLSMEPSKQVLIDRIIKLQEINAKKAEKLDFFEEHTRTLVHELQKKTKIIQNYILHENVGAMGNDERDRYKHIKSRRTPAELARHGGIMASVYNQRVSDDNMTLELSLEINQKLQAVLEDALFKNITLKDNIDTLGEEIARLTMQNQQRQH